MFILRRIVASCLGAPRSAVCDVVPAASFFGEGGLLSFLDHGHGWMFPFLFLSKLSNFKALPRENRFVHISAG